MSVELAKALAPCRRLLDSEGICVGDAAIAKLQRHIDLLTESNSVCSLVSAGDLSHVAERHIVDSLSLAAIVARLCGTRLCGTRLCGGGLCGDLCAGGAPFLDIGSGGGFPAIPVAVVLSGLDAVGLNTVLVERSERKCGFLRRVVGALGLENIRVVHGEFPRAVPGLEPTAVTARAVERPLKLLDHALQCVALGGALLWQGPVAQGVAYPGFHVEPISDEWTRFRLRRGPLHLFRRHGPA